MGEPMRSAWLNWRPENLHEPQESNLQNLQNRTDGGFVGSVDGGFVGSVGWVSGVPGNFQPSPSAYARLEAAWTRALAAARAGFASHGTTPDADSKEAAAAVLLDMDPACPPGCHTDQRRADAAGALALLGDVFRGRIRCQLDPDGTLRTGGSTTTD